MGAQRRQHLQGELSLEQLFFLRPCARVGAVQNSNQELVYVRIGDPSGGGIMGANGRLAALEILKDVKGAA